MKIGITLNEVLRDYISQFIHTYQKYIGETNLTTNDVTSLDLLDFFTFKNVDELNTFLYLEAPLEIFGHADQTYDGVFNQLNTFIMDIKDGEEHQLEIVSREVDKSIPSTLFFLSKVGCKMENLRFVQNHKDKWDGLDVLITANPTALENKPEGKVSVKVKTPYNQNTPSDFEIDSILDFIKDETLRDKILNTKITTYENVK